MLSSLLPALLLPAFAQEAPVEDELPPLVRFPELAEGGFVQAPYPEEAKAAGIEGLVVLLIEIDETGAVVASARASASTRLRSRPRGSSSSCPPRTPTGRLRWPSSSSMAS